MDIFCLLFPDFESLDLFGPVEVLQFLGQVQLHYVSFHGGMVTNAQGTRMQTDPVPSGDIDILLVPGGQGTRQLIDDDEFICKLADFCNRSRYVLSVCTGSALLGKSGVLDGRKATSNKQAFDWVRQSSNQVTWLGRARWVRDGKWYTASGISAGIDMALGFVADHWGREMALHIARRMEYLWNDNDENDPFACTN